MLFIGFIIVLLLSSCSTSRQLKNEKGNSDYTHKRLKNVTFEAPADNGYLELTSSVNETVLSEKKEKVASLEVKKKKSLSFKKRNAQTTEEEILREEIYETASQYLGIGYRSGGKAPNTGFDCSGFVNFVFQSMGIPISGTSVSLSRQGQSRSSEELKRGDLVFFGKNGNIHHVGIVSANENGEIEMIHSSSSNGISINIIQRTDYWRKRFMYGKDVVTGYLKNKEQKDTH